ncbi:hypothetical protein AGR6A_Cc150088 [Agrobacterium sp. NCPPB 925]|nr:hypothetical protein AGR6A_Cc150088 [Agrobacterium sp. NCPPB 925]
MGRLQLTQQDQKMTQKLPSMQWLGQRPKSPVKRSSHYLSAVLTLLIKAAERATRAHDFNNTIQTRH